MHTFHEGSPHKKITMLAPKSLSGYSSIEWTPLTVLLMLMMAFTYVVLETQFAQGADLGLMSMQQQPADCGDNVYTVQRGDTVAQIARRTNSTSQTIRRCNELAGDSVSAGTTLRLSQPLPMPVPTQERTSRRERKSSAYSQDYSANSPYQNYQPRATPVPK